MDVIEITSLEEYLSKVELLEETDLYRGIGNDKEFKLIPSAGRFGIEKPEVQHQFEEQLLKDFKRKAHLYLEKAPTNDFEWLFLAQHHGLPTRLMDWTYNPLVALFFAVENSYREDCAVYQSYQSRIIKPEEIRGWKDPFSVSALMQIVPNLNHIRYQNQNGLFTIHPRPAEEDFSLVLTKYLIPKKFKNTIRWKLRKIGINKLQLFPGLDSLAYDVLQINSGKYGTYFNQNIMKNTNSKN